jgi:hypothetical protein
MLFALLAMFGFPKNKKASVQPGEIPGWAGAKIQGIAIDPISSPPQEPCQRQRRADRPAAGAARFIAVRHARK